MPSLENLSRKGVFTGCVLATPSVSCLQSSAYRNRIFRGFRAAPFSSCSCMRFSPIALFALDHVPPFRVQGPSCRDLLSSSLRNLRQSTTLLFTLRIASDRQAEVSKTRICRVVVLSFFGDDITAIELPATATESASVHKKCEEHSAPPEKTRKNDQHQYLKQRYSIGTYLSSPCFMQHSWADVPWPVAIIWILY